jgi:hypothetical protein
MSVAAVALEFGTVPMLEVLEALRADCWLHGTTSDDAHAMYIRKQMLRAFYCDSPSWQVAVYGRTVDLVHRVLKRIAS